MSALGDELAGRGVGLDAELERAEHAGEGDALTAVEAHPSGACSSAHCRAENGHREERRDAVG
jgi:hypothetical protein